MTAKTSKTPDVLRSRLSDAQSRNLELLFLGFSAWGVVSSAKGLIETWNDDDGLERAANFVGLAASALGLAVSLRNFRREQNR